MASIINASTSSGLVNTADTSGILQLQSNGTTIATISSTGLVQNVGAPTFSAYPNATLTIANNTGTKILFQTEEFDTNNNFSSSTFTPTVAGYYQLSTLVGTTGGTISSEAIIYIAKNGSTYKYLADPYASAISMLGGSCLVYANGTTDYFEVYMFQYSGSSKTISSNSQVTWFQGVMVRSA